MLGILGRLGFHNLTSFRIVSPNKEARRGVEPRNHRSRGGPWIRGNEIVTDSIAVAFADALGTPIFPTSLRVLQLVDPVRHSYPSPWCMAAAALVAVVKLYPLAKQGAYPRLREIQVEMPEVWMGLTTTYAVGSNFAVPESLKDSNIRQIATVYADIGIRLFVMKHRQSDSVGLRPVAISLHKWLTCTQPQTFAYARELCMFVMQKWLHKRGRSAVQCQDPEAQPKGIELITPLSLCMSSSHGLSILLYYLESSHHLSVT
jgi:hypothetical protein